VQQATCKCKDDQMWLKCNTICNVWACKTTRFSSCVVKSTNLKGRCLDLKLMTSLSMMELISVVENIDSNFFWNKGTFKNC
jgi:hypothetical protein